MNGVIYNPLEEYEKKLKSLHLEKTNAFFDELVKKSGVDIEVNRKTVAQYNEYKQSLVKLKRKLNLFRFLRVIMIITLVLIPVVIWKVTPKIRDLRDEIHHADSKADELLKNAYDQMLNLNKLFGSRDALNLIESVMPLLKFNPCFSVKQESDMIINFDFVSSFSQEQSSLDVLSGEYNENPFLFENKLVHTMGTETYHGYKDISWIETYTDSNGKLQRRTRHQTLHATVVKPKPFYSTQVVLNYGSQSGADLCFSRDATHLERKSEREIDRYVKRGEKRLKKLTDKAIRENNDFVSMSNSEFEVLFDALDRTNEVQFRAVFTPLAQTNMVDLLLSETGYGDDFNFIKVNRMNKIVSNHSQGRKIKLLADSYTSYSFDIIKDNFVNKNAEFFKMVYFDFAPLFAIPSYQERPVHSLKPIPENYGLYSQKECETLANALDKSCVVHPCTKTNSILKSKFIKSQDNVDETNITAYSYDIEKRVEYVSVWGGDGRSHSVPVEWDNYIPLVQENSFYVAKHESSSDKNIFAVKNGLCIYK